MALVILAMRTIALHWAGSNAVYWWRQ